MYGDNNMCRQEGRMSRHVRGGRTITHTQGTARVFLHHLAERGDGGEGAEGATYSGLPLWWWCSGFVWPGLPWWWWWPWPWAWVANTSPGWYDLRCQPSPGRFTKPALVRVCEGGSVRREGR